MSGYIGTQPVPQATQTRQTFTATASQTSFATGGYQSGYLDVFLNGVKLVDGTDYTATNGSDVVLTTGAASGDTLEVVAYTAFTVADQAFTGDISIENLDVTGSFTSQGIDDNATSTAMTLDSSGNLLVGTTDAAVGVGNTNTGHSIGAAGYAAISRTGTSTQATMFLNKNTNDGTILDLRKDGSTVGSIGVAQSGDRTYFSGGSYGIASDTSDATIMPCNTTGGGNNGVVSLGKSDARFKDLYLSGGVYLGGTGSANHLDDVETGTWTPAFRFGTHTYTTQAGWYVKVGNVVHCWGQIVLSARGSSSSELGLTGLPFAETGSNMQVSQFGFNNLYGTQQLLATSDETPTAISVEGSYGYIRNWKSTNNSYNMNSLNSSGAMSFAFSYLVDAT